MKAIQKLKNTAPGNCAVTAPGNCAVTAPGNCAVTAPGNCAVTAQMLKLDGHAVASRLHRVIYSASRIPNPLDAEAGWPRRCLTATQGHISDMGIRPLPPVMEGSHSDVYLQREGKKLLPDNYRGISLLSVCSRVYMNVLIDRLKPTIEATLHEAQCGFRASRGCADQLFTMRRICELSKAGRAAFVDYRKAFDSVNREAMWTLMAARGVDPHLVSLVKEMYNGCSGEVLVQGYRSRKFKI
eukprot:gene1017-biopygen2374